MIMPVIDRIVEVHCSNEDVPEDWDLQAIVDYANGTFLHEGMLTVNEISGKEKEEIAEVIKAKVLKLYDEREQQIGEENMREFEKVVVLRGVDSKWMDHIDAMDQLRQGIHLRSYGGTDPLREYQFEGFEMFQEMINNIQEEIATYIMKAHVETNLERQAVAEGQAVNPNSEPAAKKPVKREDKVGRNDPCPCGSGKKFKQCHGA
jgi:preprotein translocase subunit SecA